MNKYHRENLFESIARCIYGGNPVAPTEPDTGWKAALARQMGMNKNAVTDTLKQPHGEKFDLKLADFVSRRRREMESDLASLEFYESELRGGKAELWIVEQESPASRGKSLVWAKDAAELAAFIIADDWHEDTHADLKLKFHSGGNAWARSGEWSIKVNHLPRTATQPVADAQLVEARNLLQRVGIEMDNSTGRAKVKP